MRCSSFYSSVPYFLQGECSFVMLDEPVLVFGHLVEYAQFFVKVSFPVFRLSGVLQLFTVPVDVKNFLNGMVE